MRWVVFLLLTGCFFDLPPALEADGCPGEEVPCGSVCIAPTMSCEPADFSGVYSIQITTGGNSCMLPNWEEGGTGMVNATITQDGSDVSIAVDGLAGVLLALGFGGDPIFLGTVEGDQVQASLRGTNQTREGNCAWVIRGDLTATLTGENTLEGLIVYRTVTNEHPDCAPFLAECGSIQSISASRAPR
ncbi:MAG: hypothetical protein AAGE52_22005 [Myxococcota bacterium]